MRTLRLTALIALVAAVTLGVGVASAFASARGKDLEAHHFQGFGPIFVDFKAGGSVTNGHGHFSYEDPAQDYSLSGKVTCYRQEGGRAVFTGTVKKENPDFDTEGFLVAVGGTDKFFVQLGTTRTCSEFDLNLFDLEQFNQVLWFTADSIVVR